MMEWSSLECGLIISYLSEFLLLLHTSNLLLNLVKQVFIIKQVFITRGSLQIENGLSGMFK